MMRILNNSDSVIIVVHEIYGVNEHMRSICQSFSDFDVICPNLLEGAPFDYSEEAVAYCNFVDHIGFTNASNKIKNLLFELKDQYKKVYLIGFSIGATIAWLCSEEEYVDGIVGYYGSRIRNYVDISPTCPTLLFFPQEEQAFNVDELIAKLDKKQIEIHKFNGVHGFSDPYSPNYHVESAQQAFSKVMDFINKTWIKTEEFKK